MCGYSCWFRIDFSKLFTLLFLFLVIPLQAAPQLKFQKLTREDGLATDTLYTVIEDQNGFLWFGGEQGVQRFDGNDFRTFSVHSIDEPKISNNLTRVLLNDHENNIWIGTDDGLNIYDQDSEAMTFFDFKLQGKQNQMAQRVRSLYQSKDRNIWIGSYAGLTKYEPDTKNVTHYSMPTVRSIVSADKDNLIIGTLGEGLYLFNRETGMTTRYRITNENQQDDLNYSSSKNEVSIIDIFKDRKGRFFISTWGNGLYVLNDKHHKPLKVNLGLPNEYYRKVIQDQLGRYWVLLGDSVFIIDEELDGFRPLDAKINTGYLNIDDYKDIYQTKNKKIWLTTYGFGAYHHSIKMDQFAFFTKSKVKKEGLLDSSVFSFTELKSDKIAIFTESDSISLFDSASENFEHYILKKSNRKVKSPIFYAHRLSNNEIIAQSNISLFRYFAVV